MEKEFSNNFNQNHFKALFEISQLLNSIQELDVLLEKVMDIAIDTLQAERGFLLLKQGENFTNGGVKVIRNISTDSISDLTDVPSSIVNEVLQKAEPVLSYDALEDARFSGSESVAFQQIRSVACVPLKIKSELIGAIYVDNFSKVGRFTRESVDFLAAFANQAAIAIENAKFYQQLKNENLSLKKQIPRDRLFPEIIGHSKKMKEVFEIISSVLDSDITVLIEGESGTGKELVARAIHYQGKRSDYPFLAFFCGALSENLLESELFGHKKGAFTGATSDKKGLFEIANHGTLFLDEIGDVSPDIQTKLLRVLQEGEIKPVGDNQFRQVNVRIISATNKTLSEEIKRGNFREDLFYRLNVITIKMPPLRQRRDDIPLLAEHFLKKYSGNTRRGFTADAIDALYNHRWPGNVRELENAIQRAVVLSRNEMIDREDLKLQTKDELLEAGTTLKDFTRKLVLKTLQETGGNKTRAADILGVSRRWLQYHLNTDFHS